MSISKAQKNQAFTKNTKPARIARAIKGEKGNSPALNVNYNSKAGYFGPKFKTVNPANLIVLKLDTTIDEFAADRKTPVKTEKARKMFSNYRKTL